MSSNLTSSRSIFGLVEMEGLKSVAIPAMGIGSYRWPVELATPIGVYVAKEFNAQYPHQLRRLFTALKHSPHPDAMKVLQVMAAKNPKLTDEDEWLAAIVDQNSLEAGQTLVALVCDGTIKTSPATRGYGVVTQLTGYAYHYPEIRADMMKRYEQTTGGPVKAMLEGALIEVADASFVLALIDNMAKSKRADDGRLLRATERLAIEQRPVDGWPGAFEQYSRALTEFRKELFALVMANDVRSPLAEACLNKIDKLRDRHGRINEEPRHPDILSGQAWPKEVNEFPATESAIRQLA